MLGLSVSLKAHIFEDPAVDSMEALNGLGHKTKDSIELSHQDGARQDRHTQGLRDHKQKYESQHKAEHQSSHPNVHKVDENTRKIGKSVQKNMGPRKGQKRRKSTGQLH